jgi:hypothetical protein
VALIQINQQRANPSPSNSFKMSSYSESAKLPKSKSGAAGAKGVKKPALAEKAHSVRKPVTRRGVIKTGSMHRFLRGQVRRKVPDNKDQFRVSKKAARLAAHAVEDIMDLLLRKGTKLKNEIAKVKIFQPEHLLYAFENWAEVHLAKTMNASHFANVDRFVNKLDIRRRSTTGAAALAHAMKHVAESQNQVAVAV